MKVGPWECKPVETGTFALDGGAMFGVVPKPLWERSCPADERNRITMAMRSLLLQGKVAGTDRNILVDLGCGDKWSEKHRGIYKIDTEGVNIRTSLKAYGLMPEDITDVFISHLHFDHVGDATYRDEEGTLHLTFPNADLHIQRANWEHACAPTVKDRASFREEDFAPVQEAGRLRLLDGPGEPYPGLHLLTSDGHTVGQQLARVTGDAQTLLFCGDVIPMVPHIQLPWVMGYDLYPMTTIEEKERLLAPAADEGWILFLKPDPQTVACTVQRNARGGYEMAYAVEL